MNDTKKTIPRRLLGKTGLEVSEIGFGLWPAGGDEWGPTDDQKIYDAIDYTLDQGVNFYDTADIYGLGHSEELLGKAMQGRRDQFIVATKIGWWDFDRDRNRSAYTSVDQLIAGVESNLNRLDTDYIDIIQSHINFRDPTMENFIEGFAQLQRAGKVRAYGVSTSDFEYLQAFNHDGHCATLQIDYSILNRMAEQEILPYCQENNIGVIVRGALAMGILTGKFTAETRFPEGDFRRNWHENENEHEIFVNDLHIVERLRPLAQGKTLAQLALQFTLAHPAVTTVIPGIRNLGQAEANLQTGRLPALTANELTTLDSVVPPGGGRKIWPA